MKLKKRTTLTHSESAALQQELRETARALQRAYDRFNYVSDPELVESCVFEINSLHAKYNYLLRLAKGSDDNCAAAMAAGGGGVCLS